MYGKKLSNEPRKTKVSVVNLPNHQLQVDTMEVNGRKVSKVVKSAYKPISQELHASAFSLESYISNGIPMHANPKRTISPEEQQAQLKEFLNKSDKSKKSE